MLQFSSLFYYFNFSLAICNQKFFQQNIKKKMKMVVSKHLTHFCYPIRPALHQRLNSHIVDAFRLTWSQDRLRVNSDADVAPA